MPNTEKFENKLGYKFMDVELLNIALTHSSFSSESGLSYTDNYERLEYIGDAYLDAVIALKLFDEMPHVREGILSKTRANIVCEMSLANVAKSVDLGEYLNLGNGEEISGGRSKDSILADAIEAVIGAIMLDGGYEKAKEVILRLFDKNIKLAIENKLFSDYKTELQEIVQSMGHKPKIEYVIISEEGPDHMKEFKVSVNIDGVPKGIGIGNSKKSAEQNAAKDLLSKGEI